MANKLTEKFVESRPVPDKGEKIYFDSIIPGFGLRITAGGTRAFILNYKRLRTQRRMNIGRHPAWPVEKARIEAGNLRQRIDKGEDPLAARRDQAAAETFGDLCDLYLKDYAEKNKRSVAQDKLLIQRYLTPKEGSGSTYPSWARRKANMVSQRDIERLHASISAEAPYQANRLVALLSSMFGKAIDWKIVESNPAKGVKRNDEHRRERFLSTAERERLDKALAKYRNKEAVAAIRLALLTGARRGEILAAEFKHFDLVHGVWSKPPSSTKQKQWHRVPLSREALAVVKARRKARRKADDLFSFRDMKRHWIAITKAAKIDNLRFHDLRHDFASRLASSGNASLPLIGALLGHSSPQTTARYAHLFDDALRRAVEGITKK